MKQRAWIVWLVTAALAGLACTKDTKTTTNNNAGSSAPRQAVAPESVPLVAEIELPSGQSLGRGNEVIDAVSPGASGMVGMMLPGILAEMVEAKGLDGADLAKPVRVLVLDPKKHEKPAVLVVSVADGDKLRGAVGKDRVSMNGAVALVGSPGALEAAQAYALATQTSQGAWPRARVFAQTLLASYRAEIEAYAANPAGALGAGVDESTRRFLTVYMRSVVGLARQIDALDVSLASHDGIGGLEMIIRPVPGSVLAQFVAAQKPASFGLLGKLPANQEALMVVAGELAAGPARDALLAFGTEMMSMMPVSPGITEEVRATLVPWMSLFTGEFACTAQFAASGMQMTLLSSVTDSAKAYEYSTGWGKAMAAAGPIDSMGIKQTITFRPNALVHDGVTVAEQRATMDVSALPPEQQAVNQSLGLTEMSTYISGFDTYMGLTMGSEAAMRSLIDAAHGKGPAFTPRAGGGERALALARARKDSVLMVFDAGAVGSDSPLAAAFGGASATITVSTGFSAPTMSMFIAMTR